MPYQISKSQKKRTVSKSPKFRNRRLVVGISIVVLIVGILYYLCTPPQTPPHFASPEERDRLANDLDSRARAFVQTAHNSPATASLEVNQNEANAYLQSSQRIQSELQSKGVSDASISFHQDSIVASASVPIRGVNVPVTVTGRLVQNNGSTTFKIDQVEAGRLGVSGLVPGNVTSDIEGLVNRGLSTLPTSQVSVSDGKLAMTAKR